MLLGLLRRSNHVLYVQVRRNHLTVRDPRAGTSISVTPERPFSTTRLLVGDFYAADEALRKAYRQLYQGRLLRPKPRVAMHPLEMTEGGLSAVETRVLHELAVSLSASSVAVHVGEELGDQAAIELAMAPQR